MKVLIDLPVNVQPRGKHRLPFLQIWDDKSSLNLPGPLSNLTAGSGMMGTHDEVTRAFFQGSDVHCAVIQRSGGKGNRAREGTVASAFFSHHQKSILCDAPPVEGHRHRRLVAFVGGLDITTGGPSVRFWACRRVTTTSEV
jgi:phospholipase D1/2